MYHPESLLRDISAKAYQFRIEVLKMVYENQTGHIGGAFSCAEIVAGLYFHHLKIDPGPPGLARARPLPVLQGPCLRYAVRGPGPPGFLPRRGAADLPPARIRGCRATPTASSVPGSRCPAGPLGHGIAVGVGMALGLRRGGKPSSLSAPSGRASIAKVYALLGDGEINAGVIWEGALAAVKYRCGNLTAILDYNGIQQTGATADVLSTEPIADKWEAFGWHVQEIARAQRG